MKIALRTALAATGIIAGLLAAPAMAQMSQAEQQRIARSLADQGYTNVRFSELDRDVIVLADRAGLMQSFAYDNWNGGLVPVGMVSSPPSELFLDRGRDGFEGDYGLVANDGFGGRGQIWGGGGISDH